MMETFETSDGNGAKMKKPMIRGLGSALAVLAALSLVACQTAQTTPVEVAAIPIANEDVSADLKLAVAGIVKRMQGEKDMAHVRFSPGAGTRLAEPGFAYNGFALTRTSLLNHAPLAGDPNGIGVGGFLFFEDAMLRRAAVTFEADYTVAKDGITFARAEIGQVLSRHPKVRMFVMPANAVVGKLAGIRSCQGFYNLAREHAIDRRNPAAISKTSQDYVIVVFFEDRIAPSDKVEVRVTDDRSGTSGFGQGTTVYDFNGWRVAVVGYNFILFGPKPLYVKVIHTPVRDDIGAFSRTEQVVGLYSVGKPMPKPSS